MKINIFFFLLLGISVSACTTTAPAVINVRPVPLTGQLNFDLEEDYLSAGRSYETGKYGIAYSQYKKLLMQSPHDERILLGFANVALAMANHGQIYQEQADLIYTQIINSPEFSEGTVKQANTGLLLLASRQGGENAGELLILAQNSTDPRVWNALGGTYDKKGEWIPALDAYLNALSFSHENGQALAPVHNNMGMSLLLQNRTREAVVKFKQAHLASPEVKLYDNNYRLGLIFSGNLTTALKDVEDRQAANLFNDAGFIATGLGEVSQARALYQQAILISPTYFQIAVNNLKSLG